MAELTTLARPYAKAVFELANGDDSLGHWSKMLALSAAITAEDTVSNILSSPSLSAEQLAQSVIDVCGDELDTKAHNLIKVLAENKRLALLPEISNLFEIFKANQEQSVDVEITTAFEISSDISTKLAAALKARLDREIKLVTLVDQSIIGGAIIRAGDTVIDSSVRGKLTKLAESMNS